MSLVVVGSMAFDAIETPFGKSDKIIGGAATYIAWCASNFTPVKQVTLDSLQKANHSLRILSDSLSDENFVNSIIDLSPDLTAPLFTELIALAPNYLEIQFNEGMDSSSILNAVYTIQPSLGIQSIYIPGAYSTSCILQFNQNLVASQFYNLQINPVADCWLNPTNLSGQFVLAELPLPGEIVINEILQNPKNGGSDWIELYNNSAKIFNLKNKFHI